MSLFGQIIIGFIGMVVGLLFVLKTEWFYNWFGSMPNVERHLGMFGGTRLFFKLLGIIVFFLSLGFMTGMLQSCIADFAAGLFSGLKK